jgi:nucleoid-associated protein YgaU
VGLAGAVLVIATGPWAQARGGEPTPGPVPAPIRPASPTLPLPPPLLEKRSAVGGAATVVVHGDTLWDIATQAYGTGTDWRRLYKLNQRTVEESAHARQFTSSESGHWLFPGTRLVLRSNG